MICFHNLTVRFRTMRRLHPLLISPSTFPNEPPFQPLAAGGVKQALTFAECLQLQGSAVGTVVDGRRRGGGGGGLRG